MLPAKRSPNWLTPALAVALAAALMATWSGGSLRASDGRCQNPDAVVLMTCSLEGALEVGGGEPQLSRGRVVGFDAAGLDQEIDLGDGSCAQALSRLTCEENLRVLQVTSTLGSDGEDLTFEAAYLLGGPSFAAANYNSARSNQSQD